jgi:hypothetical protein
MTSFEKQQGHNLFRLGRWAGDDYTRSESRSAFFWNVPFEEQLSLQQQNPSLQEAWDHYLCLLAMSHDHK